MAASSGVIAGMRRMRLCFSLWPNHSRLPPVSRLTLCQRAPCVSVAASFVPAEQVRDCFGVPLQFGGASTAHDGAGQLSFFRL